MAAKVLGFTNYLHGPRLSGKTKSIECVAYRWPPKPCAASLLGKIEILDALFVFTISLFKLLAF